MSNGVLDVLDIKDVCKYLKDTKAEFLYYPCKTILSMSSTYMDGVTSNLPQLCLNLSNPHTSAVVNSGIILGLLGVLISGSSGHVTTEVLQAYNHINSITTGTSISDNMPKFAAVFAQAKANST